MLHTQNHPREPILAEYFEGNKIEIFTDNGNYYAILNDYTRFKGLKASTLEQALTKAETYAASNNPNISEYRLKSESFNQVTTTFKLGRLNITVHSKAGDNIYIEILINDKLFHIATVCINKKYQTKEWLEKYTTTFLKRSLEDIKTFQS